MTMPASTAAEIARRATLFDKPMLIIFSRLRSVNGVDGAYAPDLIEASLAWHAMNRIGWTES